MFFEETMRVLDRHCRIVDEDADRSARPPSVIVLIVWPSAEKIAIEERIESGIEIITIRVERHEPRKMRIISAVRPAAMAPSRSTLAMASLTKTD